MKANRKRHIRRHRRQSNAAVRFGWAAKPSHRLQTGRTGSVREKQLKGVRPPVEAAPATARAEGSAGE